MIPLFFLWLLCLFGPRFCHGFKKTNDICDEEALSSSFYHSFDPEKADVLTVSIELNSSCLITRSRRVFHMPHELSPGFKTWQLLAFRVTLFPVSFAASLIQQEGFYHGVDSTTGICVHRVYCHRNSTAGGNFHESPAVSKNLHAHYVPYQVNETHGRLFSLLMLEVLKKEAGHTVWDISKRIECKLEFYELGYSNKSIDLVSACMAKKGINVSLSGFAELFNLKEINKILLLNVLVPVHQHGLLVLGPLMTEKLEDTLCAAKGRLQQRGVLTTLMGRKNSHHLTDILLHGDTSFKLKLSINIHGRLLQEFLPRHKLEISHITASTNRGGDGHILALVNNVGDGTAFFLPHLTCNKDGSIKNNSHLHTLFVFNSVQLSWDIKIDDSDDCTLDLVDRWGWNVASRSLPLVINDLCYCFMDCQCACGQGQYDKCEKLSHEDFARAGLQFRHRRPLTPKEINSRLISLVIVFVLILSSLIFIGISCCYIASQVVVWNPKAKRFPVQFSWPSLESLTPETPPESPGKKAPSEDDVFSIGDTSRGSSLSSEFRVRVPPPGVRRTSFFAEVAALGSAKPSTLADINPKQLAQIASKKTKVFRNFPNGHYSMTASNAMPPFSIAGRLLPLGEDQYRFYLANFDQQGYMLDNEGLLSRLEKPKPLYRPIFEKILCPEDYKFISQQAEFPCVNFPKGMKK